VKRWWQKALSSCKSGGVKTGFKLYLVGKERNAVGQCSYRKPCAKVKWRNGARAVLRGIHWTIEVPALMHRFCALSLLIKLAKFPDSQTKVLLVLILKTERDPAAIRQEEAYYRNQIRVRGCSEI
jgi:hypothetical protein